MSQEPNQPPTPLSPTEVYMPAGGAEKVSPKSSAGLYGMILSLSGVICWITFPIGLVVSLIALRHKPRTFAIVGSVVGAVGTLFVLLFLVAWGNVILAMFSFMGGLTPQASTLETMQIAATTLQGEYLVNNQPLDGPTAAALLGNYLDAWGNTLRYEPGANGAFVLRSAGEDLTFDTADDITYGEVYGQPPAGGVNTGTSGTPPPQGEDTPAEAAKGETEEAGGG